MAQPHTQTQDPSAWQFSLGDSRGAQQQLLVNSRDRHVCKRSGRSTGSTQFASLSLSSKGFQEGSNSSSHPFRLPGHQSSSNELKRARPTTRRAFATLSTTHHQQPTHTQPQQQQGHQTWSGSEWLQSLLLKLLPGFKYELDLLAWEELQMEQQAPGTAAEENGAKARRHERKHLHGDTWGGMKDMYINKGEEELWEVFSEFCGRDGYISSSDLRMALLKLGLPCTPDYMRMMMSELDVDHDQMVGWPDFREFYKARRRGIENAFQSFDRNGDGVISMDELAHVCRRAGIPADNETVNRMMERMDIDASHTINLKEFQRFATFLPAEIQQDTADPGLYAAWWRTTLPQHVSSEPGMHVGYYPPRYAHQSSGPFSLQSFFTCFDIVVRTSLAATLLVVAAGGFNEN